MCIFCKIVEGEIPSNKVYETEEFVAFHDLYPKAPIHVLAIPKKHICCFQEADGETMAKMTPFIQEVTRKLGIDQNGYRLVVNNGEDGGQEIHHLHVHILGGGKLRWDHSHEDVRKNI
ncbi:histidine triad nucleotide-binding protein [Nitratifractor sp.]